MTTTKDLTERIEDVVRDHLAACRKAAEAAVERAFTGASRVPRQVRTEGSGKRRAPTEMAAVSEKLYRAVCARPGETMAVLAADLDAPVLGLQRPMMHLKQAGQVRSVGQRNMTRYFPMAKS
ncbi:MAG TPA: winged helix-turn-helix domain-containing protein [Candidatus Angelobacter sp.]|jgi:hypothetical protein|nr:winged helix-turn-helix domain-containing protein [Candidatus Angelobacter sp.]